jgi:hypothetical protein
MPRLAEVGTAVMSGMSNLEGPLVIPHFVLVELQQHSSTREAQPAGAHAAPADRFAVWFTPPHLAVCAVAWFASGDSNRVLAVLVVATLPLIWRYRSP